MTRNADKAVLNRDDAINNAKSKIKAKKWYVPQYTSNLEQQNILLNQIMKKMTTELQYPERSLFKKNVNTQNFLTFALGVTDISIPVWMFVVFQQSDRQHDQNLNNDTFWRMPVTSVQCIIETKKYPDSAILLNYNDSDFSHGYAQKKEAFRALTKYNILQTYISENDFRSSNNGDNIGFNIHSFDIRYRKMFESAQRVKVEFIFSENIPAGIYGYALVLTNKLVSISSDGQRMFDLL